INPDCPGLIISAHEDFAFAQRAIRLRVVDYLLKPVSRQTLLSALERSVRHLVPNVPTSMGNEVSGETPLLPPPGPAPAGGPIAEACAFMAENYWRHSLSLEDVAARVGLSPCHFSRVFKEQTGENFTDHLTRLRLNAAARLLAETQAPIGRIALAVGYTDPNYLSRVFHHRIGITPREYRERVGQKNADLPASRSRGKTFPQANH
ncbi:MAG: DNA-binding response regulator, partial [Firmicutes bacterium]|nr:DNA-binding response regulator [Bacillota bacterium]